MNNLTDLNIINSVCSPTDLTKLEKIFVGCIVLLNCLGCFVLGSKIELKVCWETCKKKLPLTIAIVLKHFIMPLIGYGIASLVLAIKSDEYLLALAVFVVGTTSCGTASNFWTVLHKGDSHLAMTITFFSTFMSFGTMPLFIYLLGGKFIPGFKDTLAIYSDIIKKFIVFLISLLLGVFIAYKMPKYAEITRKVLRPFFLINVILLFIIGLVFTWKNFLYIPMIVIYSGILLPSLGFAVALILSLISNQNTKNVKTIIILVGFQNSSVKSSIMIGSCGISQINIMFISIVSSTCFIILFTWYLINYCILKLKNENANSQ